MASLQADYPYDAEKSRLCPPNPYPDTDLDWARCTRTAMNADYGWTQEAEVQQSLQRFIESVRPGLERLESLSSAA